ncbi:hypothetical protein GIB67_019646 [Kingdonia uniflora]|uniref:Ternary complex factor MIP1 leucine-zipper domain-containing protein n=1 Tax=Kingdonia uniflora TaxID=39325 RepID=A0A7J7N0P5_9MAGN|nr:hypothetical protein GIB67_019646 [Kingdonia uniflora]
MKFSLSRFLSLLCSVFSLMLNLSTLQSDTSYGFFVADFSTTKQMNTRAITTLQPMMSSSIKHDKKEKKQGIRSMDVEKTKATINRRKSSRERKMALQQDVDKLKQKLRHEENVHRALERAFTRPLGALPRLPPYLPPHTLELLAEVAVLEEEVVRLEEQVVSFSKGLHHEADSISSSKRNIENVNGLYDDQDLTKNPKKERSKSILPADITTATLSSRTLPSLANSPSGSSHMVIDPASDRNGDCDVQSKNSRGKENLSSPDSTKNSKQSPKQLSPVIGAPVKNTVVQHKSMEKPLDPRKLQPECSVAEPNKAEENSLVNPEEKVSEEERSRANKISEDILKCLSSIFLRMNTQKSKVIESELFSRESSKESEFRDPYGICKEFRKRDIGAYKYLCVVEAWSIDPNRRTNSFFLIRRLKLLLGKLASVDLQGLSHQQKLAFWINIYNSCMMNAFLEHGVPESPQMVVGLMQKLARSSGGNDTYQFAKLNYLLLCEIHQTFSKSAKSDELTARSTFGLEWSEPLVTFALSCGSWSSPAVRVYTASQVEKELEAAKREYLQAAVTISTTNKVVIPKLLDWYLLDFAKDLDSMMDWICLQLPDELRNEAVTCLENDRREPLSQLVQVCPFQFHFRYLLQR